MKEEHDHYLAGVPKLIDPIKLQELSKIQPWKSWMALLLQWVVIFGSVWICKRYFNPALYVATLLAIASRLHALGILMHEATHYRFSKIRWLNDVVGEVFMAWPIGFTLYSYRKMHWAHHRHVSTERDPDWTSDISRPEYRFPKSATQFLVILSRFLAGLNFIKDVAAAKDYFTPAPWRIRASKYILFGAIIGASVAYGFWKDLVLYYLVPVPTVFLLINYLRAVAEHHALAQGGPLTITRTLIPSTLERLVFSPLNVGYHLEHHLYPSVPFYNLPKLHKTLMENPLYKQQAHVTHGIFTGLYRECRDYRLGSERIAA